MKKDTDLHFHMVHYMVLVLLLSVMGLFYFLTVGNSHLQFKIVILTASMYFAWGMVHHYLEGDLHPKIMVEYLLIAILSVFLYKGVLYR